MAGDEGVNEALSRKYAARCEHAAVCLQRLEVAIRDPLHLYEHVVSDPVRTGVGMKTREPLTDDDDHLSGYGSAEHHRGQRVGCVETAHLDDVIDRVWTDGCQLQASVTTDDRPHAEIAHGKAYGALAMGMGSRALFQRAQEQAYFVSAVNTMAQGRLVPVPGGVLIQDGGVLLGAVGVSGDTSDNDEICAIAGIEAAGLKANPG